jgi:hypothetical protein
LLSSFFPLSAGLPFSASGNIAKCMASAIRKLLIQQELPLGAVPLPQQNDESSAGREVSIGRLRTSTFLIFQSVPEWLVGCIAGGAAEG